MSPQARYNLSMGLIGLLLGVGGSILGAGIGWGAGMNRISSVEKDVNQLHISVDRMMTMQFSVIRIEQATTDILRRLDAIESK